ncbi:hypothetical protein [Halobacillus sp. Nhm2S1]|uniref:hypothetical protein n=1 Tax=Halobacillus sp. Nhm2S1 TaxID=2866716 RepID=UPI001C72D220|nr:hypothetical protein [Halobacillus sp. Nhm2S1]MBX0358910.1 hypothetical protein [Halobacillus sp. Nhm2S1]
MRKLFTSIMVALLLSFFTGYIVQADTLTEDEITERFLEINEKYDVGEELNEVDKAFVKKYAEPQNEEKVSEPIVQPLALDYFYETKTYGSFTGYLSGNVTSDHGFLENSFSVDASSGRYSSDDATPSEIETFATHVAFGTVGSGGVGKVYGKTVSSKSTDSNANYLNTSRSYTASVVYSTTRAYTDISVLGGEFTIEVDAQ